MSHNDPFAPLPESKPAQNASATKASWVAILPVPTNAPAPPERHPKLGKPAGRWTYRDAGGALLGFVNRFDSAEGEKQFRPLVLFQPAEGGKPQWRWESWPTPRPLYGLNGLAIKPGARVIVCEGEKAADAAGRLCPDAVAVASPNGSKSAAKAEWAPLAGRKVIIWPDADKPGQDYAAAVVELLRTAGAAEISIINPPPGMVDGWDAADAEQDGWNGARTKALISSACIATESKARTEASDEPPARKRAPAQRDSLMGLTQYCDLWHSPDGEAFITIPVQGHRENWAIRSARFKSWLSGRAFEELGLAPGGQAIEDTLRVLEARAVNEGPEKEPWMRTGHASGRLYIDLCDSAWRAIEVAPSGWKIIERHELPFIRSRSMTALPEPEGGESIDRLRAFVNTSDEADFCLAVAWMLAALRGRKPFPIMTCQGEQGSGKSTFTSLLRSIVDPNMMPLRRLPKDGRDFAVAAANAHVLNFDNLSGMDAETADLLCSAATGAGFANRTLHTDREETVLRMANPIILNGIPDLAERADLADRTVMVRLKRIPATSRKTEEELWAEWEAAKPQVLGSLLDALAAGLRNLDSVKLGELPRMADFARWVTACEAGLGWEDGSFMQFYSRNRQEAAESAFESDVIATEVFGFVREEGPMGWVGTATDLLGKLNMRASDGTKRSRAWPMTPSVLGSRLERAAPLLRAKGVFYERRHSGSRSITLRMEKAV